MTEDEGCVFMTQWSEVQSAGEKRWDKLCLSVAGL